MKYFVTLTVECGPGSQFDAATDADAIEMVRRQFPQIGKRKANEAVRELCIHRIDDHHIMPIFSRNFALGMETLIPVADGQASPYNLGLPITLRTSLERQTEISQGREWLSEAEEREIIDDELTLTLEALRRRFDRPYGF